MIEPRTRPDRGGMVFNSSLRQLFFAPDRSERLSARVKIRIALESLGGISDLNYECVKLFVVPRC